MFVKDMVSEKECREMGGNFREGLCLVEPYLRYLEKFERLEKELVDLPEISLMGAQYFPLMLSRPICMQKELLKAASTLNLSMLPNNAHINEEIDLLKKDMANLGEDLRLARKRGEQVKVSRR
jgi:hypothetical protein